MRKVKGEMIATKKDYFEAIEQNRSEDIPSERETL